MFDSVIQPEVSIEEMPVAGQKTRRPQTLRIVVYTRVGTLKLVGPDVRGELIA